MLQECGNFIQATSLGIVERLLMSAQKAVFQLIK